VIGAMFPRGIIWLDCSDLRNLRFGMETVLADLTKETQTILDISDGVSELQNHIHFRDTLLVFDNLDDEKLATLLEPLTRISTVLLTTAKTQVLYTFHCRGSKLRPFSLNDGVQLLKLVSRVQHNDVDYQQLRSVVRQSGQMPSLIVASGSLIRSQPSTWRQYLGEGAEQTGRSQTTFSDRLFDATVAGLNAVESECLRRLVVFEPSDRMTVAVLETLWFDVAQRIDGQSLIQTFLDRNLLRKVVSTGEFKIGKIHATTLRNRHQNVRACHNSLLDNYLARFSSWQATPFDGYYENRILDHLKIANRHGEAKNVAYFILACPNDIGNDAARKCFEVLGKQADEQALTVLSATEDPLVQQACLLHLGSKARPHAKRLLRQSTSSLSGYLLSYLHGVVSCRKPHSIWYAVSPFWGYPDRLLVVLCRPCAFHFSATKPFRMPTVS
jgi:hypothetical protein